MSASSSFELDDMQNLTVGPVEEEEELEEDVGLGKRVRAAPTRYSPSPDAKLKGNNMPVSEQSIFYALHLLLSMD